MQEWIYSHKSDVCMYVRSVAGLEKEIVPVISGVRTTLFPILAHWHHLTPDLRRTELFKLTEHYKTIIYYIDQTEHLKETTLYNLIHTSNQEADKSYFTRYYYHHEQFSCYVLIIVTACDDKIIKQNKQKLPSITIPEHLLTKSILPRRTINQQSSSL